MEDEKNEREDEKEMEKEMEDEKYEEEDEKMEMEKEMEDDKNEEEDKKEMLCKEFSYSFSSNVRSQRFGAVMPGYDFMLELREEILPPNAHWLANERLHVSITHSKTHKNSMVSSFTSREDLIKVLLASCFMSLYAGLKPVEFQGQVMVSCNRLSWLPVLPVVRTIIVSHFSSPLDIFSAHKGISNLHLRLANMSPRFSKDNIHMNQSLFPPLLPRLTALEQKGYQDAVDFLKKERWMNFLA
ncbi:LOW QUALITY PROTEIN: patatin-like phospholipase domain-containing protein 4 [Carassius gibelio]|uniref:LOW QUALITY PROTEIN: patatin-like phospholipase domain-containing protein 4 n=1 Tax=Carassius gibelio TaxID=101364 RepID=UPI002278EF0F|nr:LOW QUALITY PROTEIN: patatin-like phospholipase domain-containing protein 4 [Carassius gibelio]